MIEFAGVSKHFGAQDVLNEVSFRINAGERVGIVGPNGTGKSTVFTLIEEGMSPDRGEVRLAKHLQLGHLRQQLNAHAVQGSLLEYTADALPRLREIQQEIGRVEHRLADTDAGDRESPLRRLGELQHDYEDLGGYEMTARAEAALTGLGFPVARLGAPFTAFSGGWKMRAELARTLIARPNLLMLDEPSNYLDIPAVEWMQRYLREFTGTMLLISHDRYLLDSLTEVTLEIASGQVTRYEGNYAYYAKERTARHDQLKAAQKNQDRKREHIERFVERFRAKNTKASQVQSRLKALDRLKTVQAPNAKIAHVPIRIPTAPHSGAEVVRLEQAGVGYEKDQWVIRGVDLSLQRGDRVAVVGYNGMGKTTLLRLLAGALSPVEGKRTLGHQVVIGYQSQEFAETMPPGQSVYDIVRGSAPESEVSGVRTILGSFGFTGDSVNKPCSVLSGGEKIRLAFARIFVNPPNLLILDEPTTHLDLSGRETLEQALKSYTGTVCLVSHDIAFVRNTATSILSIASSGVRRYLGGYDYYLEKNDESGQASGPAPARVRSRGEQKGAKRARAEKRQHLSREKRKLQKEIRAAEESIEELEAERENLHTALAKDRTKTGLDFASMNRRLGSIEQEIASATARWEKAVEAVENLNEG